MKIYEIINIGKYNEVVSIHKSKDEAVKALSGIMAEVMNTEKSCTFVTGDGIVDVESTSDCYSLYIIEADVPNEWFEKKEEGKNEQENSKQENSKQEYPHRYNLNDFVLGSEGEAGTIIGFSACKQPVTYVIDEGNFKHTFSLTESEIVRVAKYHAGQNIKYYATDNYYSLTHGMINNIYTDIHDHIFYHVNGQSIPEYRILGAV